MKVTLKISGELGGEKPQPTAFVLAKILSDLKVPGTVYDTFSSVDTDGIFGVEVGVVADLYECTREIICKKLWPVLKDKFDIECAHVSEAGKGFNGCIFDLMQTSACPAKLRRMAAAQLAAAQLAAAQTAR